KRTPARRHPPTAIPTKCSGTALPAKIDETLSPQEISVQGGEVSHLSWQGGCSGRPRHPRSFSLTSHALRAAGARRPLTAPSMERAVPERALHLPLVYDVPCACRRLTLAGARRSAPVAP